MTLTAMPVAAWHDRRHGLALCRLQLVFTAAPPTTLASSHRVAKILPHCRLASSSSLPSQHCHHRPQLLLFVGRNSVVSAMQRRPPPSLQLTLVHQRPAPSTETGWAALARGDRPLHEENCGSPSPCTGGRLPLSCAQTKATTRAGDRWSQEKKMGKIESGGTSGQEEN